MIATPPLASVRVGKPAPEFRLEDENGTTHSLKKYRGKVVVLEWTNPGCPFVVRHYDRKTMTRTARALRDKNVVWLAVNSSHFNKPADTRKWRKRHNIPFATLQDPRGIVGKRYGARTTPHMYVIDRRGVLRYVGAIDDDPYGDKKRPQNHVTAAVKAVVAGGKPDPSRTTPHGCSVKYRQGSVHRRRRGQRLNTIPNRNTKYSTMNRLTGMLAMPMMRPAMAAPLPRIDGSRYQASMNFLAWLQAIRPSTMAIGGRLTMLTAMPPSTAERTALR